MELVFAHQIGFEQLKNRRFNYFIAASGYENRCTYLIDNLTIDADNKIAVGFDERKNFLYRQKNDRRFADEKFDFIEESAAGKDNLVKLLNNICSYHHGCDNISFLIDYSCMSKTWYAGVLNYFLSRDLNIKNLDIYFSYTSAVFSEPVKPEKKVLLKAPKILMETSSGSGRPKALILGLGYEKYLTSRLVEKLEYDILYALFSDPAFDSRYADRVIKNNRKILNRLPAGNIYKFPVENLKQTDSLLTSLAMKLRLTHQVAILPVGPKPFSLSSLLLAARYPDIEVWSVDTTYAATACNRNPMGEPMVCKVLFSNDEDHFL